MSEDSLRVLVSSWPRDKLEFHIERARPRQNPLRLALHACDLLTDEADWDAPIWAMAPVQSAHLADTLSWLLNELRGEATVTALWEGDAPDVEIQIDRRALIELIRGSGLGTKTRYSISTT